LVDIFEKKISRRRGLVEITGKSITFSRNIGGDTETSVPLLDQQLAISLLLEIALQRGKLFSMLECVLLLLEIWGNRMKSPIVPTAASLLTRSQSAAAPLTPTLRRLQDIPTHNSLASETGSEWTIPDTPTATECYLHYNELPRSETSLVDLKKSAVTIMCHLDRLALPYNPPPSFRNLPQNGIWQVVLAMGSLGWGNGGGTGPQLCDILEELGVKSISCAEKLLLILTDTGKVYSLYYSSEAQVILRISLLIAASPSPLTN